MAVEPPVTFPGDWEKTPSAAVQKAVDDAAKEYGIDAELLYGIARRETQFAVKSIGKKTAANNKTYANSYEKYRDQKIPGSSMTWGEMFGAEQWAPWGFMQLNPYHIVGRGKFVKAGAPLSELLKPTVQARAASALLVTLCKKTGGDWTKALKLYNGDSSYRADVARNVLALREANGVA